MLARLRARGDARRRAGSAGRGPQGDVAPCGPFAFCSGRGIAGACARRSGAGARRAGARCVRGVRAETMNEWISLFLQMV